MKNTVKLITLLLGFTLVFGTSCKKYEEGPNISLLSAKSRIINIWKPDKYVDKHGADVTLADSIKNGVTYDFQKDNAYVITTTITGVGDILEHGKWALIEDNTQLRLTKLAGGDPVITTILRLKKNELGLQNGDESKIYFVTK
jgi:hypothetical protein